MQVLLKPPGKKTEEVHSLWILRVPPDSCKPASVFASGAGIVNTDPSS